MTNDLDSSPLSLLGCNCRHPAVNVGDRIKCQWKFNGVVEEETKEGQRQAFNQRKSEFNRTLIK